MCNASGDVQKKMSARNFQFLTSSPQKGFRNVYEFSNEKSRGEKATAKQLIRKNFVCCFAI